MAKDNKAKVSKIGVTKKSHTSIYKKISARTVASTKAKPFNFYIRDTELKGFWVRIYKNSIKKNYGVSGRLGGGRGRYIQPEFESTALISSKDARTKAKEWLALIAEGTDPRDKLKQIALSSGKKPSIQECHEEYCEGQNLRQTTLNGYRKLWEQNWVQEIARVPVDKIDPDVVVKWYNRNKKKKGNSTDKAYVMFKKAIDYAIASRHLDVHILELNVEPRIQRWVQQTSKKFLSLEKQLPSFLCGLVDLSMENNMSHTMRDWILFSLLHGLRSSETARMQWSMLDMEKQSFTLPARITKSKKELTLPLTNLAKIILISRYNRTKVKKQNGKISKKCHRHKKYVFPNQYGTGYAVNPRKNTAKVIEYVRKDLKSKDFHVSPHDLRSTFTNILLRLRIPKEERSRFLNHTIKDQTEIYERELLELQRETLEKVVGEINSLISLKGREYGELYAIYMKDKGIDAEFILEDLTSITSEDPIETKTPKQPSKAQWLEDFDLEGYKSS